MSVTQWSWPTHYAMIFTKIVKGVLEIEKLWYLLKNFWTQNEIENKLKLSNCRNPRSWILKKKTKSSKKGGREKKKSRGWGARILVKQSKKYMSKNIRCNILVVD